MFKKNGTWAFNVLFAQFSCEPNIALKIQSIERKSKEMINTGQSFLGGEAEVGMGTFTQEQANDWVSFRFLGWVVGP